MQFHRRLLRRQYAGIKGGRESTSTTGMFAIYYFHISPLSFLRFPHLFLSSGQISNAPKHHPDVWLHLGSIPTPPSCRAGLEIAQEPARLRAAGMEQQGWSSKDGAAGMLLLCILPCSVVRPSRQHRWVQGLPATGEPGSLQASHSPGEVRDTLRAAFLSLTLQLSWVLLPIRN